MEFPYFNRVIVVPEEAWLKIEPESKTRTKTTVQQEVAKLLSNRRHDP